MLISLGHKNKVYCFQVRKNMLITGCKNDIKVWDVQQDKLLNTLKAHTDIIRCLACDNKLIASGADDNTIRLFEQDGGNYTLTGHKGKIQCLQFDKNKLVSGKKTVYCCLFFQVLQMPRLKYGTCTTENVLLP